MSARLLSDKLRKVASDCAADDDLCTCEACQREFPIETMTLMSDNWFCEECTAEWRKHFDACDHSWTPETDEHGDPGQYCTKCSGFVRDEDAHLLAPSLQAKEAG